jgi:hypothetical protein
LFDVPSAYKESHVWLNFDGINYSAVWVNGTQVGTMRGAFIRGIFDITAQGESPARRPWSPCWLRRSRTPASRTSTHCATASARTAASPPSTAPRFFHHRLGLAPAIRDRDTGIWQKVFLSATGPVLVKDPLVTTDLPLPRTDSSDVAVQATVENVSDQPVKGVLAAPSRTSPSSGR